MLLKKKSDKKGVDDWLKNRYGTIVLSTRLWECSVLSGF